MLTQSAITSPVPDTSGLVRFHIVKDLTGLSRSTIDRLERAGSFPKRVLISANAVGWRRSEILSWAQSRAARQ
ncbi:MAG: AlpA family phage regulatory protein [Candidatus Contendobacter sp.]|nr:AlpA family phage regulatory protein [Candidatus Contendobacter sp.]MDG4557901.1 AlpA family phage regulatory protein [Candidatus Contendobacter sp.]